MVSSGANGTPLCQQLLKVPFRGSSDGPFLTWLHLLFHSSFCVWSELEPPAGPPEEMAQKEAPSLSSRAPRRDRCPHGGLQPEGRKQRRLTGKGGPFPPSPRPTGVCLAQREPTLEGFTACGGPIFRCIPNVQDDCGFIWAVKATNRTLCPTDWYLQGWCQSVWLCTTGICILWALSGVPEPCPLLALVRGNYLELACRAGHPLFYLFVCLNPSAAQLQ